MRVLLTFPTVWFSLLTYGTHLRSSLLEVCSPVVSRKLALAEVNPRMSASCMQFAVAGTTGTAFRVLFLLSSSFIVHGRSSAHCCLCRCQGARAISQLSALPSRQLTICVVVCGQNVNTPPTPCRPAPKK